MNKARLAPRTSITTMDGPVFPGPLCSNCTLGGSGYLWHTRGMDQGFPGMVLLVPMLCRFLLQSLASIKYSILVPDEILLDCRTPEQGHCFIRPVTYNTETWNELSSVTQRVNGKGGPGKQSSSHLQMPAPLPASAEDIAMDAAVSGSSSVY